MAANGNTLKYLKAGVRELYTHGKFRNGEDFRPTQRDAINAYHDFLFSNELTEEQKLKGFFELATGIGKSALFFSIIDEAHRVAKESGDTLNAMIVVPTVQLLEQTKDALTKWAPDLLESVGLYGGKYRQLNKETTIITYDSWVNLMEAGKIKSSEVDILISDEAHRGTSERRISNQFNAFANGTVQLAFTATERFDETKSVEQSHKRKIFGRSIAESVRLGELAAYIQTQLYVMRVQPDLNDDFVDAANERAAIRAGKRQEAWMRQIVEVFRDGHDEHTGDLLSDNKAGFYVGDIAMAESMVQKLNDDPVLQARAKAMGKKGVAIALHSRMDDTEKTDLLAAFKDGDYMACVSDSMLKEGFDDPSLKTIIDYPRGSLVDKAQIVGRGARKWWNEAKQRFEGCTFIDSIVYMGAHDGDEDKRLREQAMRNAVMAWSILDGTAVFSSAAELKNGMPKPKMGGRVSPIRGLDVDVYTTFEDLNAIYAEKQRLDKVHWIDLTDEMRAALKAQMERTGVGARMFWNTFTDRPEGLSETKITSWRYNLTAKNIEKNLWVWVMARYAELSDSKPTVWIDLTDSMRTELKRYIDQTSIGARAFCTRFSDHPEGINIGKIDSWQKNRKLKSVEKDLWEWVIKKYESLPTSASTVWIEFTDEMRGELKGHMERTELKAIAFLNMFKDYPARLDETKINRWANSPNTKNIQKNLWEWVIGKYKTLPDAKPIVWIEMTDPMRVELKEHMERTDVGEKDFCNKFSEKSQWINHDKIRSWKRDVKLKSVEKDLWEWVIGKYKSLPDVKHTVWIKLTDPMREELKGHMKRTDVGGEAFCNKYSEQPEGITKDKIRSWIKDTKIKSVEKDLWDAVMAGYAELPDATPKGKPKPTDGSGGQGGTGGGPAGP